MERKYYEAYDDRYRQVHREGLQWFDDAPTAIVMETIQNFGISRAHKILEIGCGEGRDAYQLLKQNYNIRATDISDAAIAYVRKNGRNMRISLVYWIVSAPACRKLLTSSMVWR